MEKTIRTVLDQAQNNNIRHGEHLKTLAEFYAKCNQQSFHDEFLRCIASIITSPSNSTFVGHALQFISSFLTLEIGSSTNNNDESQNNDSMQTDLFHPILPRVIQFFDEHKNHPSDYVRANICVLIGQTLEKMAENAELDGDLFELLVNICLDRMNDRSYQVRAQAAKSSGRLQNTKDPDDLITKRLIWLMDHDSHPLVRKESLRSIAITRSNLPHFLRRLTDTNATVRLCAYNVFAQKVQTLKVLPTKERCGIVRMGMDDPEEPVVRAFVECVVHTWIDKLPVPPGTDVKSQPDAHKTITGFLKMIDVMNIGEQTGRILKMLFDDNLNKHYDHFKDTFINDRRLIGVEQLDCESAFFWQHLVEYLSRNDEYSEKLEAILPELVDLVEVIYELIRSYHDESSSDSVAAEINFVVDCVLHVMVHCKFDDLAGRYRVETLCRDMLFMEEIVPTTYKMIMNIMKKIEPKFEHRQRKTIEMLADLEKRENRCTEHILADRKSEFEIIALRERQSTLQDSLHRIRDHDIASQNIDERVRLEKDLTEVKERLSHYDHTIISTQSQSHMSAITSAGGRSTVDHRNFMLVKRLTILCELLSTTMPNKVLPPSFITYARDLAVSSLMSLDIAVRRHAVRAVGLLAVYDKHHMMENLELINKVIENDASTVVIEGLNALGDMFIRHNALNMMKNTNNSRQIIQVIEQGFYLIAQMIDSRILNVRLTALTNMIKLFFVGQVNSGEAFSKLIVAWYDETTDIRVGGLLTTFFPAYADKYWQTDKYLFNALQPSIEGLLKNDLTKQEPTFVADAIKLFLQLHQIRERAVINHLMDTTPSSTIDPSNVDLNDPNTTNLDLTIHAHLNSSTISINKQALDKETVEKQKHEARLKYHFYVARTILTQLKSSTNDDLIRSLITTLNLIDITTDDWSIIKNLRSKSKKVNKYLTVNKRKSNLKLFIKKLSSRIELLRGFDDDNDTTLNESTLTDSSQLNATVISAVPAHVTNGLSNTPGSPLMDTAFRGLGKKKRVAKDSLLSQSSTSSIIAPPPPVARSPPPLAPPTRRNEKNTKKMIVTPVQKVNNDHDTSSCSSPSSGSDDEDPTSDVENEDPLPQITSSINKRARADATSTESLSPPRNSVTNNSRMMLRSSARKQQQQQQPQQQIPVSTPSFRQQRKHRRIDLDITPLNMTNNKKLPPTQSSTPHVNK